MTVLEIIQRSTEFLTRKGVESPRLQIEMLLAHQLGLPRLKLYLNFDRVLTETEVAGLRGMVTRRGDRVPLQHILGNTHFCGLEIGVGPEVLIPRPETELLVEAGVQWIETRLKERSEPLAVLDFGTGSGCIAIAVAYRLPTQVTVTAMDRSPSALARAQANLQRHGLSERIRLMEGTTILALEGEPKFDLVISNPPYIPTAQIETLEPEVRAHDPRMALDGGEDGLTFYRQLASEVPVVMKSGGTLMLELGDDQAGAVQTLLQEQKWVVEAIRPDYSQRPRVLVAKRD